MSDQEFKPENTEPEDDFFVDERKQAKNRNDRLDSIIWALILIWAGLVFTASNLGWLDSIRTSLTLPGGVSIVEMSTWSVIFLGAGALIFLEAVIRTFAKTYRSSVGGNFVLAAVFLGIGLSAIFSWQAVWPFVLIAMGVSALLSALIRR
jgi:uncharacterized membrane protein